ncbi:C-C chemokine receptor type 6-like [Protopterus annectens]|uniref:C-C chemokine receptor type 6-like n=1 Tax=Protopterus annectens TaxID=7888 RepID=UPI001CFADF99|nr:C-C chemokine receptor type 6-like [Protopterus annectens]XP_043944514.1 C-C chemokine receptor type 6-like [Protopterus annectens]
MTTFKYPDINFTEAMDSLEYSSYNVTVMDSSIYSGYNTTAYNYGTHTTFTTEANDTDCSGDFKQPCSRKDTGDILNEYLPIIYSLVCVFAVIGNILVLVIYIFYKKPRSMTDICLLNVALADFLFALTLPFWAVYHVQWWIFGNTACKLVSGMYNVKFHSCILFFAFISIDRCFAVLEERKSIRIRGRTLAYSKLICFIIWTISCVISVPAFLFSGTSHLIDVDKYACQPSYNDRLQHSALMSPAQIAQLSFGFCFPLLIIIVIYPFPIAKLLLTRDIQKLKKVCIVILVLIAFLASQVPYHMTMLFHTLKLFGECKACKAGQGGTMPCYITKCLAFFHCCLNPILYASLGVKFRSYYSRVFQDMCHLKKTYSKVGQRPSKPV